MIKIMFFSLISTLCNTFLYVLLNVTDILHKVFCTFSLTKYNQSNSLCVFSFDNYYQKKSLCVFPFDRYYQTKSLCVFSFDYYCQR